MARTCSWPSWALHGFPAASLQHPKMHVHCAFSPTLPSPSIAQGETVPYVICVEVAEDGTRADGGGSKGLAERAYHVDEVRGNARLAIDTEYYLAHQVPAPQCILRLTLPKPMCLQKPASPSTC